MPEIYCIENRLTGDFYIGKTKHNVFRRWKGHLQDMNHNKGKSRLYNAFRKYGTGVFDYFVMENCSEENLNTREIYWIEALDPFYNIHRGGSGGLIGEGQKGKTWKVKDTSNMKGPKTITKKVMESRLRKTGKNNYQSKYIIFVPWGQFFTWRDALKAAKKELYRITDESTLKKYCLNNIKFSKKSPLPWRHQMSREVGFYVENKYE